MSIDKPTVVLKRFLEILWANSVYNIKTFAIISDCFKWASSEYWVVQSILCWGQKIEEHVLTDLDLRNDENRRRLTSCAAAEERQDVSSKNTMNEMSDASTGGSDIGLWALWPANIPEKCGNIAWNMKQVLFDIVMKIIF